MTTLDRVRDLMLSRGLSGEVTTRGWSFPGDKAGMTWRVQVEKPELPVLSYTIPTADERWAVPTGFATEPPRPPMSGELLEDVLRRARTFKDEGGTDLKWESTRKGPGTSPTPVHSTYEKPYSVTCSHFTGMVLAGWEYRTTTYVQDRNERTGWYVPYGGDPAKMNLWQAWLSARWFFTQGDLWACDRDQIAPGDLLFFAEQNPEKSYPKALTGELTPYFGNIFHVSMYLGGGLMIQSATPTSPTGVYEEPLNGYLKNSLRFAVRPRFRPPDDVLTSIVSGGHEAALR